MKWAVTCNGDVLSLIKKKEFLDNENIVSLSFNNFGCYTEKSNELFDASFGWQLRYASERLKKTADFVLTNYEKFKKFHNEFIVKVNQGFKINLGIKFNNTLKPSECNNDLLKHADNELFQSTDFMNKIIKISAHSLVYFPMKKQNNPDVALNIFWNHTDTEKKRFIQEYKCALTSKNIVHELGYDENYFEQKFFKDILHGISLLNMWGNRGPSPKKLMDVHFSYKNFA